MSNPITPFRALYTLLGLSQARAERVFGVHHKTVEHLLAGSRRRNGVEVPVSAKPELLAEMRACWVAIEDHADRAFSAWERAGRPAELVLSPMPPVAVRGEWADLGADAIAAGLLTVDLPDGVAITLASPPARPRRPTLRPADLDDRLGR